VLQSLTQSVAAVFVHPDLDRQTRDTLRYAKQVDDLLAAIDRIRAVIHRGVEAGSVTFSGRRDHEPDDEDTDRRTELPSLEIAPTMDLMADLSGIDVVITDDRCLNRHATWSDSSRRSAIAANTLSVLVAFRKDGGISDSEYWRARHKLRAAGYYAMPLQEGELEHHLASAPITSNSVRETPELKAIRESLALPLINRSYLQTEHPWLNGVRFAVFKALRNIWLAEPVSPNVEAHSDWLLSILPDPRSWCTDPEKEGMWETARGQASVQAALILLFPYGDPKVRRRYSAWSSQRVAKPLREQHPLLWEAALDFLKQYIVRLSEVGDEP
jgi:hypothetical protein